VAGAALAVLVTGACSSTQTADPAPGGAATSEATAPGTAAPGTATTATKVQTVRIEAGEVGSQKLYTPNNLDLKVGTPYVLQLVNTGKFRHEFTAAKFFPTVTFRNGNGPQGKLKRLPGGEAEVGAGKQMDLYVTPTKAGKFVIMCEIPGHREAGMEGTITVTT